MSSGWNSYIDLIWSLPGLWKHCTVLLWFPLLRSSFFNVTSTCWCHRKVFHFHLCCPQNIYLLSTGQIISVGTIYTKSFTRNSCVNVFIIAVSNTLFPICFLIYTSGRKKIVELAEQIFIPARLKKFRKKGSGFTNETLKGTLRAPQLTVLLFHFAEIIT